MILRGRLPNVNTVPNKAKRFPFSPRNIQPLATPTLASRRVAQQSRIVTMQATPTTATAAGAAGTTSIDEVRNARVAVMSIPACPYCKRAKEALTEAHVHFVDVNVAIDEQLRQAVRDVTGKRTVPQIFVAGRSIGGCDDLLAQLADGSFLQLLGGQAAAGEGAGTGPGPRAVPPDLLTAIQEARQRAAEAQASATAAAASDPAAAAAQRLRDLAARAALPAAQGGIPRTERKIRSRTFLVFTPGQLRAWLATASAAADPSPSPSRTARELLAANLVVPAGAADPQQAERQAAEAEAEAEGVLLSLAVEVPGVAAGSALNTQFWWRGPARPASEVATRLRQLILDLYDKHLSPDGRSVSYGAIRADPRFAEFVAATAELQKVDLTPLSRSELIALTINLYNALVVHALVGLGLTRMTAAQRAAFYSRTAKYNIGGHDYSADDLENGILRGNRAGAANLFNLLGLHGLAGGSWGRGDPRLAKIVTPVDPRIHFALVCGARSCPPIKTYSAANLEEGLAAAAEAFCADEVEVLPAKREVRLSKIFKWYAVDFGSSKLERLATIASYLSEPARGQLLGLVAEARAGRADVRVGYKDYDWSLNGTD